MHILHVTPYYAPAYAFGGVVRSVELMATSLAARGQDVTVLTSDVLDQDRRYAGALDERIGSLRVLRHPNISPWLRGKLNLSTPRGMKRAAESILPTVDIVHVHEFRTLENLLATPIAQQLGKPIVLSPHGTLNIKTGRSRLKSIWDRVLGAGVASRIDHVIALTDMELAEVESLWRGFGARQTPTRFSVIPNAVSLGEFDAGRLAADFRKRYDLGNAPTALFMGRLHARKGVDVLIEAFKAADAGGARLLIVGPDEGMLPSLRALAGDDRRIVFTGHLDGEARLGALAAGDVFGLPATGEGQPMAALEAMAAGMPVALSPGCNLDVVEKSGAGYVVEAAKDAFAEKLRELLRDDRLRREMGSRGRGLVAERYSPEVMVARLEGVYEAVAQVKSRT